MLRRGRVAEVTGFLWEHHRLALYVTGLLYLIALVGFIVGLVTANEVTSGSVSMTFVVTVILLPYFTAIASFVLQLALLYRDTKTNELQLTAQSRFLSAVEDAISHSAVSRTFFSHLLDDWERSMRRLPEGVITIQKDYWKLSGELFDFARRKVECTSVVPLSYWDRNDTANAELLEYKTRQVQKLIRHRIAVSRTFVVQESDLPDGDHQAMERFFRIVEEHLSDGFQVYYLLEKEFSREAFLPLAKDFALIDDQLLMLGRFATQDRMVYHYDFFDLSRLPSHPQAFAAARDLFSNDAEVMKGQPPKLRLHEPNARRRIDQFPSLADPRWATLKTKVEQLVQKVQRDQPNYD